MNYRQGLKIIQETTVATDGTFGPADIGNQGGNVGNVDFYASGDARIPVILGAEEETDKKKKKKGKKKKDGIFRRAFIEESIDENYIIDGFIICENKAAVDLAHRILKGSGLNFYIEAGKIYLNGSDELIRECIDKIYNTIGPKNFPNQYYCLLGEFTYQNVLKKPKQRPEDYNQGQLRKGTEEELEHTENPNIARQIAMHHLDEDPLYYDKLEKLHGKPQQRQGEGVRERNRQAPKRMF